MGCREMLPISEKAMNLGEEDCKWKIKELPKAEDGT